MKMSLTKYLEPIYINDIIECSKLTKLIKICGFSNSCNTWIIQSKRDAPYPKVVFPRTIQKDDIIYNNMSKFYCPE